MYIEMSAARTYRVKDSSSDYRTGILVLSPATYIVAWGVSNATGAHMRLNEPDPATAKYFPYYACAIEDFIRDYKDVPGQPGTYIKKVRVKALRLNGVAQVDTQEGVELAHAGDWVCEDTKGNQWPLADELFRATYTEDV